MKTGYKLTKQDMTTFAGFKWTLGEVAKTPGKGQMCSDGWLHYYDHPLVAVLHNPIHADFRSPRLFKAKIGGKTLTDGLKSACTKMTLVEEMKLPEITTEQRIRYAIGCALSVYKGATFMRWADDWFSGKDRTERSAAAAADVAAGTGVDLVKIALWAVSDEVKFHG